MERFNKLISLLETNNITLSVAESCTGGLFSSKITKHPNVSNIFSGGIICYSNFVKINILDIDEDMINAYGAVSLNIAEAMARSVRELINPEDQAASLAITGVAGPNKSENKPVGFVCFCVTMFDHIFVDEQQFSGSRIDIQEQAAEHGAKLLLASYDLIKKNL